MEKDSISIMFSSPFFDINLINICSYKQDSNLFYFTGYLKSCLLFLVLKNNDLSSKIIFFIKEKDEKLINIFSKFNNFNKMISVVFYDLDKIKCCLPKFILDKNCVYYSYSNYLNNDLFFFQFFYEMSSIFKDKKKLPKKIVNLNVLMDDIRIIKSKYEQYIIRKSSYISSLAHLRAMKYCKIGIYEYDLENEILHEFYSHKCIFPAFKSIIASGYNGRELHYVNNNCLLKNNDMVIVDSGCNYKGYTSDISRTYPVNKIFNIYQRRVYNLVLNIFNECLLLLKPGNSFSIINKKVINLISVGLVDLKIIYLKLNDILNNKLYKNFYMHNIGHYIGIDVHDMFYKNENDINFEPDMIVTIEPGLYIPNSCENLFVSEKYRGINVRIEDTILITEQGHENLTSNVHKTIQDIENYMNS